MTPVGERSDVIQRTRAGFPATPIAAVQHGRTWVNRGSAAGLQMVGCAQRRRRSTPRHVGYVVGDQGA